MSAVKKNFSSSREVVVVGVNYIKEKLSIKSKDKFSIRNKSWKDMDYLHWIFNKVLGSDDNNDKFSTVPKKVVSFGNVLLDTTAHLPDLRLLEDFNLTPDARGELDGEIVAKITDKACEDQKCNQHPGGSALNTCRILAKLGTQPLFFGAVGEDKAAEQLKGLLAEHAVDVRLESVSDIPTGKCIALIYEDKATLYADIGASAKFSVEYLKHQEQTPFLRPIERKQIIYIEGFFIPRREKACDYIIDHYVHGRRYFAMNLSGTYIVKDNSDQIIKMARKAFFIFGNQQEFEALMEALKCKTQEEMTDILTERGCLVKIIVITKGADGITLITNYESELSGPGNLHFQSFNAQRVEQVVDTTGAGDAFVAAFLHYWLQKRQLSECIRIAAELAAQVCTQVGCHIPENFL